MNTISTRPRSSHRTGFTRLDLLILAPVCSLLFCLHLTASGNGTSASKAAQCLHNLKQLSLAWNIYATVNGGQLVHNAHGELAKTPESAGPVWSGGWLDWRSRSDNTNHLYLVDERYGKLAPYLNHNPRVFKCPADTYVSPAQRALGWNERVRSYSMNVHTGGGNNSIASRSSVIFYSHLDQILDPSPARLFLFLDQHPDSIDDPAFVVNRVSVQFLDVPSHWHDGAGALSYADGHVALKVWRSRDLPPVRFTDLRGHRIDDKQDWLWLIEHSTARNR